MRTDAKPLDCAVLTKSIALAFMIEYSGVMRSIGILEN